MFEICICSLLTSQWLSDLIYTVRKAGAEAGLQCCYFL